MLNFSLSVLLDFQHIGRRARRGLAKVLYEVGEKKGLSYIAKKGATDFFLGLADSEKSVWISKKD